MHNEPLSLYGLELMKHLETEEEPAEPLLSAEQQALLDEFKSLIQTESLQEPLPDAKSMDLFSLFHELAELKNEVKLESRQIKNTLDDYKELIGLLKSNNELLSQELKQQKEQQAKNRDQQRKEYALDLIEFCDYLTLSLDSMSHSRKTGWFSRRTQSAQFINQVLEGQSLLLTRFKALLKSMDVRPMQVVDKPFDSSIMCADQTCCLADRPNAQVIAELKTGYYMGSSILRPAHVLVNKLSGALK